ncbi:transposase [Candidatus Sumerlaeota bacterium]|nr:transposase [Candidatus Sumerlaeota bacterium]
MEEQSTGEERRTEDPTARQEKRSGREALWRGRFEQQAHSGLSVRAFCRREGVAEHSFYQWRRKFARPCAAAAAGGFPKPPFPSGAAAFARLEALGGARFGGGMIEIESRGGYLIRLGAGFDRPALIEVLGAIEALGR